MHTGYAEHERHRQGRTQDPEHPRFRLRAEQIQVTWEQQIELLFNRQRPSVQQWLFRGGSGPVSRLAPEMEIGDESCRREQAYPIAHQRVRKENHTRGNGDNGEHRKQGREDSADATLIKSEDGERALLHFAPDEVRDQKPGDDEEDIDPDEPAGERRDLVMKEHHRQDRDRAQPIDVGAIARAGADRPIGSDWRGCRPEGQLRTCFPRNCRHYNTDFICAVSCSAPNTVK